MKHAYLITLFLLSLTPSLFAQPVFRGTSITTPSSEIFNRHFTTYHLFQVDAPALNRYAKRTTGDFQLDLHLGEGYHWSLELQPHDIRTEDYRLVAVTPEEKQVQPRTENKTFRGKVLGSQGGETRLTLDEHFIYGFVEKGGETYYIEPARPFDRSLGEDIYLAYPVSAVINTGDYRCGWQGESRPDVHDQLAPEAGRVILACYQVDIALAADFAMVQRFGSVNGVENFMMGVLNNVQSNYDDEFNHEIFFAIPTMFVSTCSSCDPWTSSRSSGDLLNSFRAWGNSGGFNANFDVASLWTDRDFFGNAIGVAWVGSVCTNSRYNILQNFSGNSAALRVLQAHELGHNFNASHDGQGTNFIMAPSVNLTNTWSNFSQNRINNFINAIAGPPCLSQCGSIAPPVPGLTANATSGCVPFTVDFTDLSTGQIDNISWQFPGGSPSSSSSSFPTVAYSTPGTYDVILTVSNSAGTNTVVMEDYIVASPTPMPQFSYTIDGLNVSFTNTSVNAQDFQWAFGDGDFTNVLSPTHTYAADGAYLATLTTSNACGTFTFEEYIIVELPMQAGFSASAMLDCPGSTVTFDDQSTGAPVEWSWLFEGGTPAISNSPNPSVTYSTPGIYDVSLTITNALGTTSTYTQPDHVAILPNLETDFTYLYNLGGLTVQFTNTSSGADSWLWDFGDGTTSLAENPSHAYMADGIYTVTLTTSSQCGDDIISANIEVATLPSAAFSTDVLSGCAPVMAQFVNESSLNAATYQWFFQGGTPANSMAPNPMVNFNTPGTYLVTLVSTNAAGSDTITQTVAIEGGAQSAFAIDYTPGNTEASFLNQSTNADSLIWIFNNGATSTADNPSYDFGTDGVYPVTLITFSACRNDTLTQQVEVTTLPLAVLGLNGDTGCAPFTLQVTDQSSSNTTDRAWAAPGATPATSNEQNPAFTYSTPGTYTIVLEASNAAGVSRDTITVTVGDIPDASFVAVVNLGETNLSLSNDSQDADSYSWDFGDGNTSTETAPAHSYAQYGVYTVQLIATNACGNDTISQEVTVVTPPTAAFSLDATTGCAPFTVQTTDLSSSNTTGWNWSAPGTAQETSTEQNPGFTYTAPGVYTIVLEASNAAGMSTSSITVNVGDIPSASFAAAVNLGETNLSLSNDSQNADSYSWDFGDGNTSTETTPTHSYAQDGVYAVQLIATNACGNDTISQEVTVVTAPTAAFELDAITGCVPFTVQATDLSSSNTASWAWSAPGASLETSSEQNPGFTFTALGVYTIVLEASNAAGMSTSSITVTVEDIPIASFAAAVNLGETNVSLTNNSQNAHSYFWDFGDGNQSIETTPDHTYAQDGVYPVQLIAVNACGNDTISQEVTIITVPTAGFNLDAVTGCVPFTVQANDQSSANTTTWSWSAPGSTEEVSNEQQPSFTYTVPGTYMIILEASNTAGTSLDSIEVVVNGEPVPDFTFQVNGLEVQFTNTSGNSLNYGWDFGDGSSSEAPSPGHTYNTPGEYMVSLSATNECGTVTIENTVVLDLAAPIANFTLAGSQGCAPVVITFQNNSENEESVSWSFPGGTPATSTEFNPTVTYETPGVFSVTLVATNAAGSGGLTLQDVIVVEGPPQGDFEYATDEATVVFTNNTENANSHAWDFGDGNTSTEMEPEYTYSQGGEYIVTLLSTNECGTDTLEQMITLSGAAPAPNLSALVDNGCVPLSVSFDGGVQETVTSWQWSFPGGTPNSSTEPNPTVVYEQPGVYDVSLMVGNAFGENSQEEIGLITVIDAPEASFNYDIQELSLILANTSTGEGLSYSWDFGDGDSSEEENPLHTYTEAGEYTVVLTVFNACGESISETTVVAVISGLADESWLRELSLFPNPNRGAFTVRLQGQPADQLQLNLLNVVGQRVFQLKDSFYTGYWQQRLELGQLPSGVYVLEVLAGERRAYRRVVVE